MASSRLWKGEQMSGLAILFMSSSNKSERSLFQTSDDGSGF
jgi:hypothetical protein